MATRKIRLTLSSKFENGTGALVDIDFNNVNIDVDVDINAESGVSNIVKEYTVEADAGTYNLDLIFKNDELDRDLQIEKLEVANDGSTYSEVLLTSENSTMADERNGWGLVENPSWNPDGDRNPDGSWPESNKPGLYNSSYDENATRTDNKSDEPGKNGPGANPLYQWEVVNFPTVIYTNGKETINITFS